MNKPFSQALKSLHREASKDDDTDVAATTSVPDDRGDNQDQHEDEAPVADEASVPDRPFSQADETAEEDVGGGVEPTGGDAVNEMIELIDPTLVADVAVPTSGLPSIGGGSFDTTGVSFSVAEQRSSVDTDVTTATATGAIIAKIMQRKRETATAESDQQTSGEESSVEFAARIRDIPYPDELDQLSNDPAMLPDTRDDQQPVDSPSDAAGEHINQPLDDGQLVLDEAELLRASKDRVLVVPRNEKLVIRQSDLVSRQEAIADSTPEAPVRQVTAVAVPAVAVPVVEEYARNPTQNPTIPTRPSNLQLPATAEPANDAATTLHDTQTDSEHAWSTATEEEPDDAIPSSSGSPRTGTDDHADATSFPDTPSNIDSPPADTTVAIQLEMEEEIAAVAQLEDVSSEDTSLSSRDSAQRQLSNIKSEPRPPQTAVEAKVGAYLKKASLVEQFGLLAEMIVPPDPSKVKTIALAHVDETDHAHEAMMAVARVLGTDRNAETLVIDADVDRAGLTNQLALDHEEGFGEACDRHQLWLHLVKATSTRGVFFLPAGSCADPSLLEPDRLERLFVEFSRGPFSVVLIYAGDVSEYRTRALCEVADEAFVLVRLGRTDREEAQQRIRDSEIHFDGCIVTNATRYAALSD